MFTLRVRTLFLVFFTCVIPQVYGTSEASGLKIDWSRFSTSQSYKAASIESKESIVCNLLTDIEYEPWNCEIETATYELYEQGINVALLSVLSEDTDTEEEFQGNTHTSGKGNNQAAEIDNKVNDELPEANKKDISRKKLDLINRSRHAGNATQNEKYNPVRNYVSCKVDDSFSRQLSTDTRTLLDLLPSDQSKHSTTCLCVALRDKHGYIKKFVFHNGASIISPVLRTKAHALGYDLIQVEQSHAEGEFIQFLLRRHQVRPGLYTHIMGIGCSRLVCAECDHLFKMFFGDNYQNMRIASAHNDEREITVTESNIDCCLSRQAVDTGDIIPSSFVPMYKKKLIIEVPGTVLNSEAIDMATYSNYYMPRYLQQAIQYLVSRPVDFSNERFNKSEQAKRGRRKRK